MTRRPSGLTRTSTSAVMYPADEPLPRCDGFSCGDHGAAKLVGQGVPKEWNSIKPTRLSPICDHRQSQRVANPDRVHGFAAAIGECKSPLRQKQRACIVANLIVPQPRRAQKRDHSNPTRKDTGHLSTLLPAIGKSNVSSLLNAFLPFGTNALPKTFSSTTA
jgi:hypothetical protein